MFIPYKQNGLTLLEMSIGLTVIALAIGATVAMYNGDTQKAESVITQLQMAKAGVLRYNMDNPSSTNKLADLVQPNEVAPHNWNGPYVDSSIRMTGEHFDISNAFPETHLELTTEVIGGTRYQALIVKGNADTQLRNAILAQCGDDCKPLPGREDLGLLIQQVAAVAPNTSGMPFTPSVAPATPLPPVVPEPPWIGPPTVTPPTIPYAPPPGPVSLPSVPTPPAAAPVPAPNPCAVVACTQPPVPSTPIPSPTPPAPTPPAPTPPAPPPPAPPPAPTPPPVVVPPAPSPPAPSPPPPPPPPPSAEYEVPFILKVHNLQGEEVGSYQCGTAKIAPHPYFYYYHTEIKDAGCKSYYPPPATYCGTSISYMPEFVTKPTVYYGLLMQIGNDVCGGA